MTNVQIKQFREILFWPLEIRRLSQQVGQDEIHALINEFEGFFTSGGKGLWQREKDLLARGDNNEDAAGSRYAELVYFHPFVQRFLYPKEDLQMPPPMRLYRRNDIKWVLVVLGDKSQVMLAVDRIHFYLFDHGVAILVMEVSSDEPLSLGCVEELLDRFRRAYPPYWDTQDKAAGHCPQKVEWLNSPGFLVSKSNYTDASDFIEFVGKNKAAIPASHWQYLLQPLLPWETGLRDDAFAYRQIEDERMPFMAYLSLDDPSQLKRGDFVRLCLADGAGDSDKLPYAHSFLRDFEKKYCYDRFWDPQKRYLQDDPQAEPSDHWMTTRYLCCGYGFVMIGKEDKGDKYPFFTDAKNGALSHFRRHYFQMGLIAHFHRAALLLFSDALSEAVANSGSKNFHQEVKTILERLLHFTHRYWFREVSNQVQPRELFALWTKHLETQALFDQVKQEAQDANDFLEMQAQRKLAEATMRLSVVATIGLPTALIAAYLAVPWDDLYNLKPSLQAALEEFPQVLLVVGLIIVGMWFTLCRSECLASWLDDWLSNRCKSKKSKADAGN